MTYPKRVGQYMVFASGKNTEENIINNEVETKIINKDDYKLVVKLRQLNEDKLLTISHWLPELGWQHQQLILSQEEFTKLKGIF